MSVTTVVTTTTLVGLLAVAVVGVWTASQPIADHALVAPSPIYPIGFLLLAIMAEIVFVPLRHSDGDEELTFFEVLLLTGVLVFIPIVALVVPLIGYAIAGLILRRPLQKILFNLGSYAISGAVLIIVFGLLSDNTARFSFVSTVALILGALLFAGINLLLLSWILHAVENIPVREFLREQWSLSAGMAIGSVGVAATAVALATYTPVLTPFALLPAAALWYAYSSSAQHGEARERNKWIVDLSTAVSIPAPPHQLVPRLADSLRRVFNADDIRIITDSHAFAADEPGDPVAPVDLAVADLALVQAPSTAPGKIPKHLLPAGWESGSYVTLELAEGHIGAVLLGATDAKGTIDRLLPWAHGPWALAEVDAPVFQALAVSFGGAMRASQHLIALTEETAKLTAVVDNATDGIVVVDDQDQVVMWSPAMASITGVPADTAVTPIDNGEESGTNVEIVHEFVSMAQAAATFQQPATDQHEDPDHDSQIALAITRQDGTSRDLSVSVVWIEGEGEDEAEFLAIMTVRDITRERRAERAKSDFIATISHELRTPITPIRGYAQLLAQRWEKMNEKKRAKILLTIEQRADHLSRLVDDLLLSSQVSDSDPTARLQVERQRIPIIDVVNKSIAAFPDLSGRFQVSEIQADVRCDSMRAVQCLSNLLSNAGKYSEPGSPIEVEITAPEGESWVSVEVIDSGRGIPADELGRVFERFYRVEDPMTMTTGGSGLGLYISRELARAMDGDITAESVIGQGSRFGLRLPRWSEAGESS